MASSSIGSSLPATRPVREVKIAEPQKTISKRQDSVAQQQKRKYCAGPYVLDYIPLASTIKNFIDIVLKIFWRPSQPNLLSPKAKAYYEHITQKSFFKCIIGMVPVLGNIVLVFDHENKKANDANLIRSIEGGNESAAYHQHLSEKGFFRCVIGMLPFLDNDILACSDARTKDRAEYLIQSIGHGQEHIAAFRELYRKGTPEQKDRAVEAACKASAHKAYMNAYRGNEYLSFLLKNGEKPHQQKAAEAVMSLALENSQALHYSFDLQDWLIENLNDLPKEVSEKFVEKIAKAESNGAVSYHNFFKKLTVGLKGKFIESFIREAEKGNAKAAKELDFRFGYDIKEEAHNKMIADWFLKHAENPASPHHKIAFEFVKWTLNSSSWTNDFAKDLLHSWNLKQLQNSSLITGKKEFWDFLRYNFKVADGKQTEFYNAIANFAISAKDKDRIEKAVKFFQSNLYGKNYDLSMSSLMKIAESGNFDVLIYVAEYCLYYKHDKNWAQKLFKIGAEKGHVECMYQLALTLKFPEAKTWYEAAANKGHVKSMSALGAYYANYGSTRDYDQAIHWYQMAADHGDTYAKVQVDYLKTSQAYDKQQADYNKQREKWRQDDRKRQQSFENFFHHAYENESKRWNNAQQNEKTSEIRQGVSYYQTELETLFGEKIPNSLSAHDFKGIVRKWQLRNHPDKADAANKDQATERFKKALDLIEAFKGAKKRTGEAGWDYK